MKILTKKFLETLNEQVNEEDTCVESTEIFEAADLGGYDPVAIPRYSIRTSLPGLINECEIKAIATS